ncbi:MAG TPA: LytTR family DNA-binding domain-containing protein [Pyrinomonadaceae bacterium]|nr:LytTR family DNA-binding domain-containing protein [Pyrinomonadaceae bacterium]
MTKIRALIVDDEPLARERVKRFLAGEPDVEVIGECSDGIQTVAAIETLKPDLILLDIQIPEADGFAVIEKIGVEKLPPVIFITSYDQYALRAFDVHAVDYLLKPYNRERFQLALERVRAQLQNGQTDVLDERLRSLLESLKPEQKYLERLMIKSSGRVIFLRTEEIEWIEAEGNYLRIHAGREAYMLRETMNNLAAKLDPSKFARIHRSTLVQIERIKELQPMFGGDYVVILHNGTQLTLSRSYRDKLLEHF